jgi:hypothetical protein
MCILPHTAAIKVKDSALDRSGHALCNEYTFPYRNVKSLHVFSIMSNNEMNTHLHNLRSDPGLNFRPYKYMGHFYPLFTARKSENVQESIQSNGAFTL